MNAPIGAMLRNSEGRYLNADEKGELLAAAAAVPAKLQAAEDVERHEDAVIRTALEEVRRRYPNFEKAHDQAFPKIYRDVQFVVRFDVQAMLVGDIGLLDDKVLYWLRGILAASNVTPGFVRDTFTLIRDGFEGRLPAEAFAAMKPFFDRNVEVLADFPEPAAPAV